MSFLCEWGSGSRSGKCWLRESDRAAVQQLTVWDECSNWIRSEALKIWQFKKTSMCPHVTPCIWWYCVVAHLTLMIKQWFLVFYLRPVLQQCWAHEWWPAVTSWYWSFQKWQILKDKGTKHNFEYPTWRLRKGTLEAAALSPMKRPETTSSQSTPHPWWWF